LKKSIVARVLCVFLFVCLVATALLFNVGAMENDYSYPSALYVEKIYADDFLNEYTDITLSDEEAEYLRLQSGFLLAYNKYIPTYAVSTSYEDDRLTVAAEEYVYTAENGVEVIWVPVSASLGDEAKSFDSSYTLTFYSPDETADDRVNVKYACRFNISEDTVKRLFNLAYTDAPRLELEIEEKRLEYEQHRAEYLINTEKYNDYLSALVEYNAYLSAKRIYDEKYLEYTKYLSELSDYEIAKAAYDKYLAEREKYYIDLAKYTEYLAYAEQNLAKIEEYAKYQEKYETVLAQLDVIQQTKTKLTPLQRTVYDAIMGETVTSVINRKGDIVKVLGANADVVDLADVATKNLRVLLKTFFECKTVEEQYRYYITNYEAFRDNFVNLLKALDDLYLTSGVRGAMIAEDKHEKYLILVAQLYYVANALSDEPIKSYNGKYYFDSSYKIGSTYSSDKWSYPKKVIYNEPFIVDTDNAFPLRDGYPIEPEKPEYTLMHEPVSPKPVINPVAPDFVEEPKAPAKVDEPQKITKPTEPIMPSPTPSEVVAIINAYNSGNLLPREEYTGGDITVSAEINVYKLFAAKDDVTVKFYDSEYNDSQNKEVLYSISIDRGTAADYLGKTPEKREDAEYVYTHIGWVDADGEAVDLSAVNSDTELYPVFEAIEKEYETVWVANGEVFYENPGLPPLPSNEFYYDFSRWDRVVDPSTHDVTYLAVYETPAVTSSQETVKVRFEDGNYFVEPKAITNRFDISVLLERASGSGGIVIVTQSGQKIAVSYAETIKLREAGVCELSYSSAPVSGGGNVYAVFTYGDDGEEVVTDVRFSFSAECDVSLTPNFKLYYVDSGEKRFLRPTLSDNTISFSASAGKIYYAMEEYSLTPVPLDAVKITLSTDIAHKGELIGISLDSVNGIRIDGVYFMGHDGKKEYLDGHTFIMPADDVTVGVDYTVLRYKITFVSDGKTIATYYRNYGDPVTPPSEPQKAPNEKYSFTFERWSPSVENVTRSVTYTAVYSSELLPVTEKSMEISPSVLKLLLLAGVGLGCFVVIVVPSVIMTLVLVHRRKRKLLKPKK